MASISNDRPISTCSYTLFYYAGTSIKRAYVLFATHTAAVNAVAYHRRFNTGITAAFAGVSSNEASASATPRTDSTWTEAGLKAFFGQLGEIRHCHMVTGENVNVLSFAVIRFKQDAQV